MQYSEAIVKPGGQRKNDWWILSRILQEMGKPSMLDEPDADGWAIIEAAFNNMNLSLDTLKNTPGHTIVLSDMDEYATTYERMVLHPDKKIDCCPEAFADALYNCETIFHELANEPSDTLKIISLRTNYMHNSWMSNMPQMRKGGHANNPLNIHPEDAIKRGLENGQWVTVYNAFGEIETQILFSEDLRPGVVAMTHGYGHRLAPSLSLASEIPGSNVNRLLPTGIGSFEALSGMSWMNGVSVEIKACATA